MSPWGESWGDSWGSSWGSVVDIPPDEIDILDILTPTLFNLSDGPAPPPTVFGPKIVTCADFHHIIAYKANFDHEKVYESNFNHTIKHKVNF